MKTTFEELKAELLLKAKNNNACQSGYIQAEKCETKKELVQVIADNFVWIWQSKTMTIEDLNKFDSELLQSVGIFANYEGIIKSDLNRFIIVGSSSPTIETYDSSSPRIETYGTSSPRIETYGSSSPRIVTYGTSSPRIVTYQTSSPTIETYGSSSPRIETYGSSSPRISGFTNCIIESNLSLIINLDNSVIIKSDKWSVE